MNTYPTLLAIHSAWRWLVLLSAAGALIVSVIGLLYKLPFKPLGRRVGLLYVTSMDVQFLIGVVLYCISPLVRAALGNMAAAMKQHDLRFFAVEHTTTMLIALVLAHVGSVRSKRAANDRASYLSALVWYSASFLFILAGIPWWRPLLRAF